MLALTTKPFIVGTTSYTTPLARLSTGRVIAVGLHSYSSLVLEDGSEMDRSDWTMLSDEESREAWVLVDARLHARNEARR